MSVCCVCMCAEARGQHQASSHDSLPWFLRHGKALNLEFTKLAKLISHQIPGTLQVYRCALSYSVLSGLVLGIQAQVLMLAQQASYY